MKANILHDEHEGHHKFTLVRREEAPGTQEEIITPEAVILVWPPEIVTYMIEPYRARMQFDNLDEFCEAMSRTANEAIYGFALDVRALVRDYDYWAVRSLEPISQVTK